LAAFGILIIETIEGIIMPSPNEQSQDQTKKCPKCKEDIQIGAKKCKHCGADLRNWFVRHKIITAILTLLLLGIIGSAMGGDDTTTKQPTSNNTKSTTSENTNNTDNADQPANEGSTTEEAIETSPTTTADTDQSSTPESTTPSTTTPDPAPEPTSSETVSQQNAVAKAKSYLDYSAFSHDGLVDQLEYEQFLHADGVRKRRGSDSNGSHIDRQRRVPARN